MRVLRVLQSHRRNIEADALHIRRIDMLPVKDSVVNGVRCVVYDSAPHSSSEAVVFVHGNPGPSDDWDVLAPRVAKFARVIAMDLPGYGRAEHPHQFDFTVSGYATYLGALLDQLGVQRAHLVLHDFGGGFGLGWAAAHPDRVASITLINTGILKGYRWHKFAKIWQTPVLGELFQLAGTAALMQKALDADNPRPLPKDFAARVLGYADWNHKRAVLALYRATRNPDKDLGGAVLNGKQIELPTCVIWGEGDAYLPVRYAEAQREVFPHAEVHTLPGLGHWPFVDDPQVVGDILTSFLQKQVEQSIAAQ
jgi:pimeloyl-ACP methyl ester carboxylesterase